MQQDHQTSTSLSLSNQADHSVGLNYDSESIAVDGRYADELSAFRARRAWTEILETNFLLERDHDYSLETASHLNEQRFHLRCTFMTACGRYAFWRLINDQAPEIQYLLETAHVPNIEGRLETILRDADPESELFRVSVHTHVTVPKQGLITKAVGWLRAVARL